MMVCFHSEILSKDLDVIKSGLEGVKTTQDLHGTKIDQQGADIKLQGIGLTQQGGALAEVKVAQQKQERSSAGFMLRLKGNNLPARKAKEDVAGVVLDVAKKVFGIEIERGCIVSAKRNFKGTSIIVR